ncbi:cytochrome c oxidase subunit 7A2, mitochondrial-like [Artemia franciscana]|uniref:cytochrome c oxidase subunit 7A2, mitochondrial-like n=1 Tax=Artemia franciscana TaxID=6661 RepID=UPI0032D9DEEC
MKTVLPLVRSLRQLSTSRPVSFQDAPNIPKGYSKVKELQKKFQIDDGKPIHLKGGKSDELMAVATGFLCVYGVANALYYIYTQSFPQK